MDVNRPGGFFLAGNHIRCITPVDWRADTWNLPPLCYSSSMRLAALFIILSTALIAAPRFEVTFSAKAHESPADGRLIVIVSKALEGEPRFQVSWGTETQQIFGIDVDGLKPAEMARVDSKAAGHPLRT